MMKDNSGKGLTKAIDGKRSALLHAGVGKDGSAY